MHNKITLSEFEGQALSDMNTLNTANTKAIDALEEEIRGLDKEIDARQGRVDALANVVSERERRITEGIEASHGVSLPRDGLKMGKDKDGRYVIEWESVAKKAKKKAKKAKKK